MFAQGPDPSERLARGSEHPECEDRTRQDSARRGHDESNDHAHGGPAHGPLVVELALLEAFLGFGIDTGVEHFLDPRLELRDHVSLCHRRFEHELDLLGRGVSHAVAIDQRRGERLNLEQVVRIATEVGEQRRGVGRIRVCRMRDRLNHGVEVFVAERPLVGENVAHDLGAQVREGDEVGVGGEGLRPVGHTRAGLHGVELDLGARRGVAARRCERKGQGKGEGAAQQVHRPLFRTVPGFDDGAICSA